MIFHSQQLFTAISKTLLQGLPLVGGAVVALSVSLSLPASAQESECTLMNADYRLDVQLESVEGESIQLGNYPDGLQTVVVGSRSTATQSREALERLRLEFDRYEPFRRVLVLDATRMAGLQNRMRESMQETAADPDAPLLAPVFQGEQLAPLQELVRQEIPGWDAGEQAILFILNGSGQVLSLHTLDQPIAPAQQCLREQVRELELQISSAAL